jgi:hypothetical protein
MFNLGNIYSSCSDTSNDDQTVISISSSSTFNNKEDTTPSIVDLDNEVEVIDITDDVQSNLNNLIKIEYNFW